MEKFSNNLPFQKSSFKSAFENVIYQHKPKKEPFLEEEPETVKRY